MTAHPDFGSVVLENERHAEAMRQPQPRVVVQAVALVDERDRAAARSRGAPRRRTRRSARTSGSSLKFQKRSGTATWWTSTSGRTVGTGAVVIRIGGSPLASSLSTPAMWPTEPPARTPKLRSVRRYNGAAARFHDGVRRASRDLLRLPHLALDLAQQRALPERLAHQLPGPAQQQTGGHIALAPFGVDDVAAAARHQPQGPAEHRPSRRREPLRHQAAGPVPPDAVAALARSAPTRAAHRRTSRPRQVRQPAAASRSGRRSTDCRACDQPLWVGFRIPYGGDQSGKGHSVAIFSAIRQVNSRWPCR